MIISRYLRKQILFVSLAVMMILMVIFMSHELVRYVGKAASGKVSAGVLIRLMMLQVPILIGLLLPLALFMGVLLAFGRAYIEQEMTVLFSCGVSQWQLLGYVLRLSLFVAVIAGVFTLWLNPLLLKYKNTLLSDAAYSALVDTLPQGRFKAINNGKMVFYVEHIARDRGKMQGVFVAQHGNSKHKPQGADSAGKHWRVMSAQSARLQRDKRSGSKYIQAKSGHRYTGVPGQSVFEAVDFDEYGILLTNEAPQVQIMPENMSLQQLWDNLGDARMAAELQWRVATPISVLLFAAMGFILAKTDPRSGRYAKVFPAVLIYVLYGNLLFVNRKWVASGKIGVWLGSVWLHLVVIGLFALLWWMSQLRYSPREWLALSRQRRQAT